MNENPILPMSLKAYIDRERFVCPIW